MKTSDFSNKVNCLADVVGQDFLLFYCHTINGFSFASHIDFESGLYKFDDGMCDFDANGFDCRDCTNYKCLYRKYLN